MELRVGTLVVSRAPFKSEATARGEGMMMCIRNGCLYGIVTVATCMFLFSANFTRVNG